MTTEPSVESSKSSLSTEVPDFAAPSSFLRPRATSKAVAPPPAPMFKSQADKDQADALVSLFRLSKVSCDTHQVLTLVFT